MESKYRQLPEKRKESLRKANAQYVKQTYSQVHLNLKKEIHKQWIDEAHARGFTGIAPFIRWCVSKIIESGEYPLADSDEHDTIVNN